MAEPPTRVLFAALGQAGIVARFVGGCVRDALLGRHARAQHRVGVQFDV